MLQAYFLSNTSSLRPHHKGPVVTARYCLLLAFSDTTGQVAFSASVVAMVTIYTPSRAVMRRVI